MARAPAEQDDQDDLGLSPEDRRKLRRGLVQALAREGAKGNASAAKAALGLIDGQRTPDHPEREAVVEWLEQHPEAGAAEAVDAFNPGVTGRERSRLLVLYRQWIHRFVAREAVPGDPPPVASPDTTEADLARASLPRVAFLRAELADALADLRRARAGRATPAGISTLRAQVDRLRKQLDVAIAESGEGAVALDRSPLEVAAEIERRQKTLDVLARARARQAAKEGG